MHPFVVLIVVSVVGVVLLFIALAVNLNTIILALEAIGGPTTRFRGPANYLSKIRLGLRAIEVETGGIVPQVTRLNAGLMAIGKGLQAIDSHLGATIESVSGQKAS